MILSNPQGTISSSPRVRAPHESGVRARSSTRAHVIAACVAATLLATAACRSGATRPALPEAIAPRGAVRMVAEWEPALGAVITYPFEIPDALVLALAEKQPLFVLVDPGDQDALTEAMKELGVRRRGFRPITAPVGLPYTRDFGPHQIVDGDGALGVLDQVFRGYPVYDAAASRSRVDAELERFADERGDDRMADVCAAYFEFPRYVAPFVLTGGNFLVDGAGTAFFTDALVDENAAWYTAEQFFALLHAYTGCTNLVHLPNVEEVGIQHVDCWLKVLPGNRLLVQRAPADHPARPRLESAVRELAGVRDASGRPFEILRIDCPVVDRTRWGAEAPIAAYTNSLILNDRVYVPLYGVDGDEIALATWRAALPDHEVLGFPDGKAAGLAESERRDWESFDALHCRTRAIYDREKF